MAIDLDLNLSPPHSPPPPPSPVPQSPALQENQAAENQENEEQALQEEEVQEIQEQQHQPEEMQQNVVHQYQQLQHLQNMGQEHWIPLPPGMLFQPTDAQIVQFYLPNKLVGGVQFIHHHGLIFEADLFATHPAALLQRYRNDKGIAYIFSPRYRLYPNSISKVRRTVIDGNQVNLGRWGKNMTAAFLDTQQRNLKAGFVFYELIDAYRREEVKTNFMVKEIVNLDYTLPLGEGILLDTWAFYKLYNYNEVELVDVN